MVRAADLGSLEMEEVYRSDCITALFIDFERPCASSQEDVLKDKEGRQVKDGHLFRKPCESAAF